MKKRKFGAAFADQLAKVSFPSGHFRSKKEDPDWKDSLIFGWNKDISQPALKNSHRYFFIGLLIISFLGLFLRLFHLQIIEGHNNRATADSNRIAIKLIHAPRGVIYDRNGKILAQNEPGFRLLEGSSVTYLTRDQALDLEVHSDPRMKNLEVDNLRSYPMGKETAHILGYTSEITEDELKDLKFKSYKLGDRIGRVGVEQIYETVLRGVDGGEIIEVDAKGNKIRSLRQTPPIPGQNLYLTIDADLQAQSYKLLEAAVRKSSSCCGAEVAQDPNSGQILALVSIPSFEPGKIENYLEGENSPFLNRVIAGRYPPGSIFKIVSSLAGLISGKINSKTQFEDTGVLTLGTFKFTNWYFTEYGRTEGLVDILKALQRSNDIFFYRLGQITGEELIAQTAKKLGYGKKLGIDLPGEVTGLIPNGEWKQKNIGDVWYPGDTLHMAIGQGFVLVTPLQVNNVTSIIASSGKQFPPHLALKITGSDGATIKQYKYNPSVQKEPDEQKLKLIKAGLELVPKNGGTAWPFFNFPIATAGKTGTAEFGDPTGRTHAWYTLYAPADQPKIALTVLVEGAGEGSNVASPVAKEILRWYLSPDKNNLIKDIYPVASESAKTLGE